MKNYTSKPDLGNHSKIHYSKGDTISLSIVDLSPDGSFNAKCTRYGTIYHCSVKDFNSEVYKKLYSCIYKNSVDFTVVSQDLKNWTKLVVDFSKA